MKWENKIQKFMYGRYGIDELYNFTFVLYLFVLIIDIFFNSIYLSLIEIILIFIIFYRFLSKDISRRTKENREYLKLKKKILKPFINIKKNISDRDNVYKKCHKCKTTLKLPVPYERGIKYVKCPKCRYKNKLLILRKQKIEIIRN